MCQVLAQVESGVGEITLNRPKALNSLNTNIVTKLEMLYQTWSRPGSGIQCITLKGAGDKVNSTTGGGGVQQHAS